MSFNKKCLALLVVVIIATFLFAGIVSGVSYSLNKDVVKIMDNIHIETHETVNGDVVAVGGSVRVDGVVNGDVTAIGGNITVKGSIRGSATSVGGSIRMEEGGQVFGEKVSVNVPIPNINIGRNPRFNYNFSHHRPFGLGVWNLIPLLALGLLATALMPNGITSMANHLPKDFGRVILVGFIGLILLPFLVIVTIITILGIPLVPLIILAFVVFKFIGYVAVAVFIGRKISELPNWNLSLVLQLIIGVFVLWVISQIPVVSGLAYITVTIISLGLVLETKFGSFNPWFSKKSVARDSNPKDPVE